MVYLFGIVPGQYLPVYPVYIMGDHPKGLSVYLQVDEATSLKPEEWSSESIGKPEKRQYITYLLLVIPYRSQNCSVISRRAGGKN